MLHILRRSLTRVLSLLVVFASACAPSAPAPAPTAAPPIIVPTLVPATNFVLTSSAFNEGGAVPKKFSCDGENISPQLKWSGTPVSTRSFALIMDDPDAPLGTFTHWVVFDLPATQNEIAEGAKTVGKGGQNSTRRTGYTGPCPPSGTHRYFFTLYALDMESLGLSEGASRADVEKALSAHILAKTQLMGRYSR